MNWVKKNWERAGPILMLAALLAVQIFIFATHVGKGFVTDDFNWLENVVFNGKTDFLRPFTHTTGFFRPLVGISFGVQYALHGMNPEAYGLFNLFLHLSNIILVYLVLSSFERLRFAALFVVAFFALNAKAVNMAVCWVSGRTTLLFSFFTLLSLYTLLKYRPDSSPFRRIFLLFLTGFFFLAALLSKESAAAVPIFVFFFTILNYNSKRGGVDNPVKHRLKRRVIKGLRSVLPFTWPLVVCSVLRAGSDAFTPFSAPHYYRYDFSPGLLLRNLSEYIGRSSLLDIYILLILLILALIFRAGKNSRKPHFGWTLYVSGILWYLCFLLPVLPLASRSDLYAYFPQIGLHVVFVAVIFHSSYLSFLKDKKKNNKTIKQRLITITVLVFILVFWTSYLWSKAVFFCELERNSALFTKKVVRAAKRLEKGSRILVIDLAAKKESSPSKTVSHGFPSLLNLYYPHKHLKGKIIHISESGNFKDEFFEGSFNFIWKDGRLIRYSGKLLRE